jgi:hypothetical protein
MYDIIISIDMYDIIISIDMYDIYIYDIRIRFFAGDKVIGLMYIYMCVCYIYRYISHISL